MKTIKSKLIIFIFIPFFAIQSCAGMKSTVLSKKSTQPTNNPAKDTAKASVKAQAKLENQARKLMEAGEYQKAIDIYSTECRQQPQNLQIMKEYSSGLDGIKASADKALENKDFAYAGRLYYLLRNNCAKFSGVEHMISFGSAYLDTNLAKCKKSLSVKGFEEYRKGDINKALSLWHSVLAIDPNDKSIKEAVRTAELQRKNLQEAK